MAFHHLFQHSFLRFDNPIFRETVIVINIEESVFDNDVTGDESWSFYSGSLNFCWLSEAFESGDRVHGSIFIVLKKK